MVRLFVMLQVQIEKMQEMLNDVKVNYHKNSAQSICGLIKEEVKVLNDPSVNKAYEILSSWDGEHKLEDVAPTIFYNTLYKIMYYTMVDEIGAVSYTHLTLPTKRIV